MEISVFGSILKEFESYFKCPLTPDKNNSCLVKLNTGISVQLEIDRMGQLLIGCKIATMPMNRFRENVIREALKANESVDPSEGIFGFSQKTNTLMLFMMIDPKKINPDLIAKILPPFTEKAKLWADTIATGKIPSTAQASSTKLQSPMSIFGSSTK